MSVQEGISNLHAGETWAITGTVSSADGPVDLTDATISMRIDIYPGAAPGVVVLPAVVTDGVAGEYKITSEPAARGAALPAGAYNYQVWCVLPNGSLIVPSRGKITVMPDIPAP